MVDDITLEQRVEAVLDQTMAALRDGRERMFEIFETANSEYDRIQRAIENLKLDMQRCLQDVDNLEALFGKLRRRLYQVNQEFERFSDDQRQEAYEEADSVRERLAQAREREQQLRARRSELERGLLRIKEMVERAEALLAQVGVALDFLQGNMDGISEQMEGIKAQRLMGRKIIQVQEEERKRVAREIHDGPAQDLANVVLKADLCEKMLFMEDRQSAAEELQDLKGLVKLSLKEVRRIMFNLRPMALDDLGLVPTLHRYLDDQSWAQIDFVVEGAVQQLSSDMEVTLFRIIQEAMNNSRKHAGAKNVFVRLEYAPGFVTAEVGDDGIGFGDLRTSGRLDHYGLMNMRERAEYLGGTLSVNSQANEGTRIKVRLPLNTEGRSQDGNKH